MSRKVNTLKKRDNLAFEKMVSQWKISGEQSTLPRTEENILGALESQARLKMASEFLAYRIFHQGRWRPLSALRALMFGC